jgi:hypothetical protein
MTKLTFEDLSPLQKAVLDIAHIEGRVLIAGTGLAHYITAAQALCRRGYLEREEGTNWYKITEQGALFRGRGMIDDLQEKD